MAKDEAPPAAPIMPAKEVEALLEAAERDDALVKARVEGAGPVIRRDVN